MHEVTAAILDQPLLVLASVLTGLPSRVNDPNMLLERVRAWASRPQSWLSKFAKKLIQCDIEPQLHHRVAGISDAEWPRCLHDAEAVMPVAATLRVLLVKDLLDLASAL